MKNLKIFTVTLLSVLPALLGHDIVSSISLAQIESFVLEGSVGDG